jgi:hypothetical protein
VPHRNRQRKTMQIQKATAPNCHLVVILELPTPHKERKQKEKQKFARFLTVGGNCSVFDLLLAVFASTSLQRAAFAKSQMQLPTKSIGRW